MATKKKTTKKAGKKKTSNKKVTKKVSKKKATRKKRSTKTVAVMADDKAENEDLFNPQGSTSSWSPESGKADVSESKSTMGRIGVIAVLAGLVIAFAIMQKNDMFGDKKTDETQTENVTPVMEDASNKAEETKTETTEQAPEKTEVKTEAEVKTETTNESGKTYTVKSGDTLWKIAKEQMGAGTKTNIDKIKSANNLTSNSLSSGTVLKIPAK